MHISYKPLWHTLLERDMRKEDLRLAAGMTTNMIANMSKEGKHISMDTLARICETLNCECSATSFLRNWDSILEKKRANLRSISEPARLRQPPPQKHGSGTRKRAGSKHTGGATNSRPSRAFCPLVG